MFYSEYDNDYTLNIQTRRMRSGCSKVEYMHSKPKHLCLKIAHMHSEFELQHSDLKVKMIFHIYLRLVKVYLTSGRFFRLRNYYFLIFPFILDIK